MKSTQLDLMVDLKVYERGHLGYFALIPGLFVLVLGLFVVMPFIGGGNLLFGIILLVAGSALTAKGIREAGKPLLRLLPNSIHCVHKNNRIRIPLSRVEKAVWKNDVLYLHVSQFADAVRISMNNVPDSKILLVKKGLEKMGISQFRQSKLGPIGPL